MTETDSIGAHLRAARERLGLGVIQVAERLHVDVGVVEALEGDQFAQLGPPVFVRGHLRHYARLLGESDEALQSRYAGLQESLETPDLSAAPRQVAQPPGEALLRWPLVLGAGVTLLALLLWFGLSAEAAS
ncbi:MAG: helix-turn-helix transcriptional regulator [Steroidobacteraceae bacterium]